MHVKVLLHSGCTSFSGSTGLISCMALGKHSDATSTSNVSEIMVQVEQHAYTVSLAARRGASLDGKLRASSCAPHLEAARRAAKKAGRKVHPAPDCR